MKYRHFNIHRFGRLTRWNVLTSWKVWFRFSMIMTIMITFGFCVVTYETRFMEQVSGQIPIEFESIESILLSMLFVIWITVVPSMMFNTLQTKQQRIEYFTLPATNLERYTSRFTVTNLAVIVATIVSILIADIIRFVFKAAIGHFSTSLITVDIVRNLFCGNVFTGEINGTDDLLLVNMLIACVLLAILCLYTCYLLGAALFRKANWILTSLITITILLIAVPNIVFEFPDLLEYENRHLVTGIVMAVFFGLSAFNVWASYKLFTRMQVINNKWVNL